MITFARVIFFIIGALLAGLCVALPRILVGTAVILVFALLVEPRLPVCHTDARENRKDQFAIILGALLVFGLALLAHRI